MMIINKVYAYVMENQEEVNDPSGFIIEDIAEDRLFIKIRNSYDDDQIYNAIAKIYPDHYQFIKVERGWDTWGCYVPHRTDGRISPMVTFRSDPNKIFNEIKEIVLSR